jgi:hypothetical protein
VRTETRVFFTLAGVNVNVNVEGAGQMSVNVIDLRGKVPVDELDRPG